MHGAASRRRASALLLCKCAQGAPWCFGNTPWMLSADFLVAWGARWGPLMRRQPWRFVTSWFVHESFMHLLSNMLLFMVVASQARPQARRRGRRGVGQRARSGLHRAGTRACRSVGCAGVFVVFTPAKGMYRLPYLLPATPSMCHCPSLPHTLMCSSDSCRGASADRGEVRLLADHALVGRVGARRCAPAACPLARLAGSMQLCSFLTDIAMWA